MKKNRKTNTTKPLRPDSTLTHNSPDILLSTYERERTSHSLKPKKLLIFADEDRPASSRFVKSLMGKLQTLENYNFQLLTENRGLIQNSQGKTNELASLSDCYHEKLEKLHKVLNKSKSEAKEYKAQYKALQTEHKALIAKYRADKQRLTLKFDDVNEMIEELHSTLNSEQTEKEGMNQTIKELKSTVNSLEPQNNTYKQLIRTYESDLANIKLHVKSLEDCNYRINQELDVKDKSIKELEEQLDSADKQMELTRRTLKNECDEAESLVKEIASVGETLATLTPSYAKMAPYFPHIRSDSPLENPNDYTRKISVLQTEINELDEEYRELLKKAHTDGALAGIRNELNQLAERIEGKSAQLSIVIRQQQQQIRNNLAKLTNK